MGEVITYLIEHNHSKDDIYHRYTIDQLWLFYEKSVIISKKRLYEDTVAFSHCMGLPLGGKEAAKALNKFLKTLLPLEFRKNLHEADRQERIRKARPDLAFQKLGIPLPGGMPPPEGKPSGKPRRAKPPRPRLKERPPIPKPQED